MDVIKFGVISACLVISSLAFAANKPAPGEITMEQATQIAKRQVKGTIKSSEYEHEKGQNVYSFDIAGTDGKIHEILVSARDSKVVSNTIESQAKEAAEQKSENGQSNP